MRLPAQLALAALGGIATLMSCADPTAPRLPRPGVSISISGPLTDSAGAAAMRIRVGVGDEDRLPLAGVSLSYAVVGAANFFISGSEESFLVPPPTLTGPDGKLTLWATFSCGLGSGWLRVTVVSDGITSADSVPFEALPGKPDSVRMPVDTAVYQGNSVTMRAVAADKCGHALANPVVLEAATAGITVSGNVVQANAAPSRQLVRASVGTFVDSTWLSIVPTGELSVLVDFFFPTLPASAWVYARLSLDGTLFTPILTRAEGTAAGGSVERAAEWMPGGNAVVFQMSAVIARKTMAGVYDTVVAPLSGGRRLHCPMPSADGTMLYSHDSDGSLYRSALTASGATESIFPFGGGVDVCPAPSPDGRYLAFASTRSGRFTEACADGDSKLHILDQETNVLTVVGAGAYPSPRWSPDGAWIATASCGNLYVVSPTGSNYKFLGSGYSSALSWAPDSKWFAVQREGSGIHLVNRETGTQLPLGFTAGLLIPSWRK